MRRAVTSKCKKLVKHKILYQWIKNEILSGNRSPESVLPSESQFIRRFGYSRTTVRKALDELRHEGLIRSSQGRGSVVTDTGVTKTFGLILPGASRYEYFQSVVTELSRVVQENRGSLLFVSIDTLSPNGIRKRVRDLVEDLICRQVKGIIYHPIELQSADDVTNLEIVMAIRRAKIPVVLLDCDVVPPPQRSAFDLVSIDNIHAAEMLADHLFASGASNVGVLMLPQTFPNMLDRVRGVENAARRAGRTWSDRNVLVAKPTDIRAVRKYLANSPHLDAVICQNDALAAEFAQTLSKLRLSVPNDILLAGFDGLDISRLMSPPLTTIRQSSVLLSRKVFDALLWRIDHPNDPPMQFLLPQELVVRASTRR